MITEYDLLDGIKRFVLKNDKIEVSILNYGCIIEKIIFDNKNMVLSYSDCSKYKYNGAYIGAVVGRTSGRITNCVVNNYEGYNLDDNNNGNHLHGGENGLSNKIFDYEIKDDALYLSYYDDCEKYYPSKVHFTIKYSINESKLLVEYYAKSDKDTYINLTNHTYFNLNYPSSALNQTLQINADKFFELKDNMQISDTPKNVENTIFDFRKAKKLSENINDENSQFDISYYFDHTFLLNKNNEYDIILKSEESKISLKVKTSNRAVVMYAGNFLHDVACVDGQDNVNQRHIGICLETQDVPNGINNGYYNLTTIDSPYYEFTEYNFEKEI